MTTYLPGFECETCGANWSATFRAVRYFNEEERTQTGRIAAAHGRYGCAAKIVKVRFRERDSRPQMRLRGAWMDVRDYDPRAVRA